LKLTLVMYDTNKKPQTIQLLSRMQHHFGRTPAFPFTLLQNRTLATYCNGKQQRLSVWNLWKLWRHSFRYASAFELKVPSRAFERKRQITLPGRVEVSRNETTLHKKAFRGARAVYPRGVSSRRHSEGTANDDGDSERIMTSESQIAASDWQQLSGRWTANVKLCSGVQMKKCMSEILNSRPASWPGEWRTGCMRTKLFVDSNS